MATGAPGTNGVWQYGEDDSEATFSALLNKAAGTTDTQIGLDRTRLTALELPGRVVNTVQTTKANAFTTTSTSFTDVTGMSVSITPKKTSNKVLVTASFIVGCNTASQLVAINLVRNSTAIGLGSNGITAVPYTASAVSGDYVSISFLDSPATTSATTYKLQVAAAGGAILTFGVYGASGGIGVTSLSTITVQEIAA